MIKNNTQLLPTKWRVIAILALIAVLMLSACDSSSDSESDDDADTPSDTMEQSENTDTTVNDTLGEDGDGTIAFESQGNAHLGSGEVWDGEYNSNPPTSGPHAPSWVRPLGVYTEVIADIFMIHNLEHGHVWLSYRDADDQEALDALIPLQEANPRWVILTHRPENDTRIAVASWTRLLLLDEEEIDTDAIEAFISNYRDNAPESVPEQG